MRRNCMSIFHYCAELLRNVPLFETCSNRELLEQSQNQDGAIYNDFDGCSQSLVNTEELSSSQLQFTDQCFPIGMDEMQPSREDIDQAFLQADEDDRSRWDANEGINKCIAFYLKHLD